MATRTLGRFPGSLGSDHDDLILSGDLERCGLHAPTGHVASDRTSEGIEALGFGSSPPKALPHASQWSRDPGQSMRASGQPDHLHGPNFPSIQIAGVRLAMNLLRNRSMLISMVARHCASVEPSMRRQLTMHPPGTPLRASQLGSERTAVTSGDIPCTTTTDRAVRRSNRPWQRETG